MGLRPELRAQLALVFEQDDSRSRREVQTSNQIGRRQPQRTRIVGRHDAPGQATRLAAEDEAISRLELDIPDGAFGKTGEEEEAFGGQRTGQLVPGIDRLKIEVLPVIEARPTDPCITEIETCRLHDPKLRPDRDTRPPNVTGVRRDLRLVKHDMSNRTAWRVACQSELIVGAEGLQSAVST